MGPRVKYTRAIFTRTTPYNVRTFESCERRCTSALSSHSRRQRRSIQGPLEFERDENNESSSALLTSIFTALHLARARVCVCDSRACTYTYASIEKKKETLKSVLSSLFNIKSRRHQITRRKVGSVENFCLKEIAPNINVLRYEEHFMRRKYSTICKVTLNITHFF